MKHILKHKYFFLVDERNYHKFYVKPEKEVGEYNRSLKSETKEDICKNKHKEQEKSVSW